MAMANGSGSRWTILVVVLFVIVAGGLVYFTAVPPGVDDARSPREARLEQLKSQIGPAEHQQLALAPWLNANAFKVGAVFPMDGSFAMARSTACDEVATQVSPVSLTLNDKTNFAVTPDLEIVTQGKITANGTRAIQYSVDLVEAVVAPGEVELLSDLYNDADCLAAIANRDVLVLFAIYRGSEEFAMKRAATAGFDFGVAIANLKENLGLETEFSAEDKVTRADVAMYWALTKVRLDEPIFGTDALPESARLAIATDLVATESDYAQRAIPNTTLAVPDRNEVSRLIQEVIQAN